MDPRQEVAVLMAELQARSRYVPRKWAERLMASYQQRGVAVIHRRGSKTTSFFHYLLRAARDDEWEAERLRRVTKGKISERDIAELLQGRQYAHILPTKAQARLVVWPIIHRYVSGMPGITALSSEAAIKIAPSRRNPLGARIQLFGADDPKEVDRLRGYACWGAVYDEYGQIAPTLHSEVLSKSLADHYGFAHWIGTVKGKNQLYRIWRENKDDPAWFSIWQDIDASLKTERGATVDALRHAMEMDRKEIAKGLMTQEEYDQEWYLSLVAAVRGAYFTKLISEALKQKRIGVVNYDPALPVYDVWDIGVGPQLVVGAFQRDRAARQMRLIKTYAGSEHDGIPQMIARLKQESWVWGKHFAPHDIKTTDPSTGASRFDAAAALGWKFEVVPTLHVGTGIDKAKALWPRLWVDERNCEGFLDVIGLYRQQWDQKNQILTGAPVHDAASHYADMLRYAAVSEDEMVMEEAFTPAPAGQAVAPNRYGRHGWQR